MAGGLQGVRLVETFTSEWDLSSKQYHAVQIGSADDKCICISQANYPAFGIVMNKPTSGEAARVCIGGYTKAVAGAAVTRNSFVVADAAGYLINRTDASSSNVVGLATQGVASGSIFSLILMPHQRIYAP